MMDRRSQRALLLVLFFGVAVILYRSLGVTDHIRQRGGRYKVAPDDHTSLQLDPRKLNPANSTLGVRQTCSDICMSEDTIRR